MIASEGAAASVRRARQAPAGPAERPIDGPPTTEGQCTRWGPTAGAGNNSTAAVRPHAERPSVSPPLPAASIPPEPRRVGPISRRPIEKENADRE